MQRTNPNLMAPVNQVIAIASPDIMPPPDALIVYPGGHVSVAMFHYAPEYADCAAIARDCGFELTLRHMSDNHPLMDEYSDGASDVIERWLPDVPAGWQFAGKSDTEDGPCALFLRRLVTEDDPNAS